MKHLQYLLVLLCCMLVVNAYSQTEKKIIRGGGEWSSGEAGILDVPELAVFFGQDGENIAVQNVMDADSRPKGYEDIDIELGDIVLMANGKRVKTVEELTKVYKNATPGTEIKLGIKRGEKMMITSFDKIDPEKLPKRTMIIRRSGDGGDMEMMALPQIGLFLSTKGSDLVVHEVMPQMKEALPDADVKEGDVIEKINGEKVTSFKQFSKTFEELSVGDKVELVTSRSGKTQTIKFKKPENKGGMKVIKRSAGN